MSVFAHELIAQARKKGVRLWSENGQLRYRALKGSLTADELNSLRQSKAQIAALLGGQPTRAPMTFSQLAHWRMYRLHETTAIRQIATATRLDGRLDLNTLRACISSVVRRQSALRTRIVLDGAIPSQEISESDEFDLVVIDLCGLSSSEQQAGIAQQIESAIMQPIDVAVGPLFGVRLLKLGENSNVLITVMEHMISDMHSSNILLRDIFDSYERSVKCLPSSDRPVSLPFSEYAQMQRDNEREWVDRHRQHWRTRLQDAERLRFPRSLPDSGPECKGWGSEPIHVDPALVAKLREWARARRTTLVMVVFTAYIALVLRWCNASTAIFQYVTDGRNQPDLENTIGYFASMLYLRLTLDEGQTFEQLLPRVLEEYLSAYAHADAFYMESQHPAPEFIRNSAFNWTPSPAEDRLNQETLNRSITLSPIPFEHPMLKTLDRDSEPVFLLSETHGAITGQVLYPSRRFGASDMKSLAGHFLLFLTTLANSPRIPIENIPIE